MDNPLNITPSISSSPDNSSVNLLESSLFGVDNGTVSLSNSNAEYANAIIINDDGVRITNSDTTAGIRIGQGITFLSPCSFVSKGTNIKKGEYSENPNSNKIFTYQETVLLESMPKEIASQAAGKVGINLGTGLDGVVPIITDISAGPLPHFHTISMKHVHRLEPAYLYRIPPALNLIKSILPDLQSFFSI